MLIEDNLKIYDVLIIGAGPAGCSCALFLKDRGIRVALLDSKSFPRDKVCGDAIAGRAVNVLRDMSPEFIKDLHALKEKTLNKKTKISYGNKTFEFNWVDEAYTCTRLDFDNFLLDLVKKYTNTDVVENSLVSELTIEKEHVTLVEKRTGFKYRSKIIIGADGANGITARQLTHRVIDRDHHVGSVRAYFTNISNIDPGTIEVFFDKHIYPGYLWIFPLPDNKANVGYGMLSSEISKRNINLRTSFHDIITSSPALATRFKEATQISDVKGFGLPLGSRRLQISGDRFMLVGDAASLIDPISGEGIGNAMLSGKLAGEQVVACINQSDFSSNFINQYDIKLADKLGKEFRFRYRIQRLFSKFPFLLDIIFSILQKKWITRQVNKWF